MFDFMSMMGNYEQRKVANFTKGKLTVDTCRVLDSQQDYETGVEHPDYNKGKWVIVSVYSSKEEAIKGHQKWVKIMTKKTLPKVLQDVSTAKCALLSDIGGTEWRKIKREER